MAIVDIYNTATKYDIIYTDPPWKQTRGGVSRSKTVHEW